MSFGYLFAVLGDQQAFQEDVGLEGRVLNIDEIEFPGFLATIVK